jgi:hypothetical protein
MNGAKDHGVSDAAPVITLSVGDYDAVLFDLDGVLTKTANGLPASGVWVKTSS